MAALPSRAHAWVDAANLVQNTISAVQSVQEVFLANQTWIKEYILDVVQKGIATNIEDRILDSALTWARTGFNGQPSFVVNPRDLVLSTEENEALLFVEQLNNVIDGVCAPYQNKVRGAVAQYTVSRAEGGANAETQTRRATECKLDALVTSGVIDNYFSAGGFVNEGGLAPLLQIAARPADDPFTAEDPALALQSARQEKAVREAQSEIFGGTLPNKVCIDPGPFAFPCNRYETNTPAGNVSDFISKAIGHSLDEISGQDEIAESIFAAVVRRFTDQIITDGLR
jgi:hypothetical protein